MNNRLFYVLRLSVISISILASGAAMAFDPVDFIKQTPIYKSLSEFGEIPNVKNLATSFDSCKNVFFNGRPPILKNSVDLNVRPLCFDGFATLYSAKNKIPIFSAEVMNKKKLNYRLKQTRTDIFFEDARLRFDERATLEDYRGSGFDRGHNFPAGNSSTPESMAQSFSLANIFPQAPVNNQKLWNGFESDTRKYVMRASGDVYVITGSLIDKKNCTIESALSGSLPAKYDAKKCTIGNGVAVPTYIYKVVYDPSLNRAWAYWTVNKNDSVASKPITYSELVARTGIIFFPGIKVSEK
jgi:endonuclease G